MKHFAPVVALMVSLFLTGCAGLPVLMDGNKGQENPVDVTRLPPMRIVGVSVNVPWTLSVSEENSYKPKADIVWREDPLGNRFEQVKAIFETAAQNVARNLQGDLPVVVHIEVRKFHALTQKTRYSIGGTHAIEFLLSVTNGRTGDVIVPPYLVVTNLKAYGGEQALAAERVGLTQKVRITTHLTELIRQELTGVPMPPVEEVALQY